MSMFDPYSTDPTTDPNYMQNLISSLQNGPNFMDPSMNMLSDPNMASALDRTQPSPLSSLLNENYNGTSDAMTGMITNLVQPSTPASMTTYKPSPTNGQTSSQTYNTAPSTPSYGDLAISPTAPSTTNDSYVPAQQTPSSIQYPSPAYLDPNTVPARETKSGTLLPAMDASTPTQATSGSPSAVDIIKMIAGAPFRALGAGVEGVQSALGLPAAQNRAAQDAYQSGLDRMIAGSRQVSPQDKTALGYTPDVMNSLSANQPSSLLDTFTGQAQQDDANRQARISLYNHMMMARAQQLKDENLISQTGEHNATATNLYSTSAKTREEIPTIQPLAAAEVGLRKGQTAQAYGAAGEASARTKEILGMLNSKIATAKDEATLKNLEMLKAKVLGQNGGQAYVDQQAAEIEAIVQKAAKDKAEAANVGVVKPPTAPQQMTAYEAAQKQLQGASWFPGDTTNEAATQAGIPLKTTTDPGWLPDILAQHLPGFLPGTDTTTTAPDFTSIWNKPTAPSASGSSTIPGLVHTQPLDPGTISTHAARMKTARPGLDEATLMELAKQPDRQSFAKSAATLGLSLEDSYALWASMQ